MHFIFYSNTNEYFFIYSFVDFDDFASFTISSRGKLKLIRNGFDYDESGYMMRKQATSWRCGRSHSIKGLRCNSKAITKEINGIQMIKVIGKHTHPPMSKEKWNKMKSVATSMRF